MEIKIPTSKDITEMYEKPFELIKTKIGESLSFNIDENGYLILTSFITIFQEKEEVD